MYLAKICGIFIKNRNLYLYSDANVLWSISIFSKWKIESTVKDHQTNYLCSAQLRMIQEIHCFWFSISGMTGPHRFLWGVSFGFPFWSLLLSTETNLSKDGLLTHDPFTM
jgi:hypothetical protein